MATPLKIFVFADWLNGKLIGTLLAQQAKGKKVFSFEYDKNYLQNKTTQAVSCTLPLTEKPYYSKTLFAFFDGLIPEGWLLDIAEKNWKISYKDRMGLLLTC